MSTHYCVNKHIIKIEQFFFHLTMTYKLEIFNQKSDLYDFLIEF